MIHRRWPPRLFDSTTTGNGRPGERLRRSARGHVSQKVRPSAPELRFLGAAALLHSAAPDDVLLNVAQAFMHGVECLLTAAFLFEQGLRERTGSECLPSDSLHFVCLVLHSMSKLFDTRLAQDALLLDQALQCGIVHI